MTATVRDGNQRVTRDARICRLNRSEARQRIPLGVIEEEHAGFAVLPRALDDAVPDFAGGYRARNGLRARIHEIDRSAVLDGVHERVRHADRNIEVVDLRLKQLLLEVPKFFGTVASGVRKTIPERPVLGVEFFLALHEFEDIGMVDAQDAHVGTAPHAALFDRIRRGVEDFHERDGTRRIATGALHLGTLMTKVRERKAGVMDHREAVAAGGIRVPAFDREIVIRLRNRGPLDGRYFLTDPRDTAKQ